MSRPADGPLLFARYAYPPNALGYCGPGDSQSLLELGADPGSVGNDEGLRRLARRFEGAWPYVELIAAANRIEDPLDPRVVEAYWIGNELLDNVGPAMLDTSLEERFRARAAIGWRRLVETLDGVAFPHHNFHVFSVYPFVALLNNGRSDAPLRVLDQCRIRPGVVEDVTGAEAIVRSRDLAWTGSSLLVGASRLETVTWQRGARSLIAPPRVGEVVALHWDWVCDVLSPGQVTALDKQTARQLAVVNERVVSHP